MAEACPKCKRTDCASPVMHGVEAALATEHEKRVEAEAAVVVLREALVWAQHCVAIVAAGDKHISKATSEAAMQGWNANCALLESTNAGKSLLAAVEKVREALPTLRRAHDHVCPSGGLVLADDPPCHCGAAAHNATIDDLLRGLRR